MFLVLARHADADARRLVESFGDGHARLLVARDLSRRGWCVHPGRTGGVCIASGERIDNTSLTGVVCRLPAVFPHDLGHVDPADRDYVAAEMTAFLVAWLAELPCPQLNPVWAGSLGGPAWGLERWFAEATRVGLAVEPFSVGSPAPAEAAQAAPLVELTVIGDTVLPECPAPLAEAALHLSKALGIPMLGSVWRVDPNGVPRFCGASVFPELRTEAAHAAVRRALLGGLS